MLYLILAIITTYVHAISVPVGEPFVIDIPHQPYMDVHLRIIQASQPLGYCCILDSCTYEHPVWHCTCRMTQVGSFPISFRSHTIQAPTVYVTATQPTIPPLTLLGHETRQAQVAHQQVPYKPFWPIITLLCCFSIYIWISHRISHKPDIAISSWTDCLTALNTIAHTNTSADTLHIFFREANNQQLALAARYIEQYSYCPNASQEYFNKTKSILLRYLPFALEKQRQ